MTPLLPLLLIVSVAVNVGLVVWIYNRERQIQRQVKQLDPLLADIAAAIRERS